MSSWQIPGRLQRQQLHLHHQSRHQDSRNKVNNKMIKVQVWDTGNDKYYSLKIIWLKYSWGGQQRYRPNLASCYRECWLMASEVTELVSTGETWTNFNASCSGFIFTTSLLPTSQCTAVLAGSLAWSDCWEGRQLRAKHQDNVKYLCQALLRLDIRVVFFLRDTQYMQMKMSIFQETQKHWRWKNCWEWREHFLGWKLPWE